VHNQKCDKNGAETLHEPVPEKTNTAKIIQEHSLGQCDAERKRIYALGGEGFISVVQQNDPNHYALRANIPTTAGVRTGVFFGTSLYAGVPAAGLEPAQIWNYAVPE
jgi:hypothetical protein